ncbi:MAG: amidohydrolase family protein [Clostridia bacterium]|nr:amidohydrolase family protein [Clostridia bacterium]
MTVKKIDMHVHAHFAGGPERLRGGTWPTPEELRPAYDALGIEKGVEMARCAPERMHDPITSRDARALSAQYPETLGWWFCALDPRMATNSPEDNLSYYLDYFKEQGAKGVGELQANMYIDDPKVLNLFSHIEKSGLPVTIHFGKMGEGCGVADDIGLPRLEKVLEAFPKLKILAHAMTFWSEISADVTEDTRNRFPTGKITKEGRVSALLRKYPGLLCDISAKSGLNAFLRDKEFAYKFIEEFNERIFFATDISSPTTLNGTAKEMCAFLDDAYANGNISLTAYKNICRENALRLLNAD